jgi:VanZ family protein
VSLSAWIARHRRPLRRLWGFGLIAYLGLIALASLLPPPELPMDPGRYDKLWHAAGYALAALLCVPLWRGWRALLLAGLGLVGYGLLMELLQAQTAARSGEWLDALANTSGVAIGLLAALTPVRGGLGAQAR